MSGWAMRHFTRSTGNGAENEESTAKDFLLFASIFNQKMIISGYTEYVISLNYLNNFCNLIFY